MHLESSLRAVGVFTEPENFENVRKHVDPGWVATALEATGTASVRKRRLPAEQVVWLVMGAIPPAAGIEAAKPAGSWR